MMTSYHLHLHLISFLFLVLFHCLSVSHAQVNTNATIRSPEKQRQWLIANLMSSSYEEQVRGKLGYMLHHNTTGAEKKRKKKPKNNTIKITNISAFLSP